jgi:hypothetical protein
MIVSPLGPQPHISLYSGVLNISNVFVRNPGTEVDILLLLDNEIFIKPLQDLPEAREREIYPRNKRQGLNLYIQVTIRDWSPNKHKRIHQNNSMFIFQKMVVFK